jgi:hypothetical protein
MSVVSTETNRKRNMLENIIFRDVMLRSLVEIHRRFGGTKEERADCCFVVVWLTLKMETAHFSQTLVKFHQIIRRQSQKTALFIDTAVIIITKYVGYGSALHF